MTGKEVLPGKRPSEKAARVKRFEYSPLGNKLKKQTGIAEKTILRIRQGRKYNKSDLTYNGKHSFYKYYDVKRIGKLFFKSKYSFLVDLFNHLDKFSRLRTKEKTTGKKWIYFDEYYDLLDGKGSKMDPKYFRANLICDGHDYDQC